MRSSAIRIMIERLRKKMHNIVLEKGISHEDVLRISQLIDKKLNEIRKIQKNKYAK